MRPIVWSARAPHPQAKRYRDQLTPERKAMLEEKLTASTLFKGKKASYDASCVRASGRQRRLDAAPLTK